MNQKALLPVIAVINSNEDIVEAIAQRLEDADFPVATGHVAHFKKDSNAWLTFLRQYNPSVIIFDIAPPYEENWKFFLLASRIPLCLGRHFILTTTNQRRLAEISGMECVHEILGKPEELEQIVAAVKRALLEKEAS